jgi:hypothetical protein
MKSKLLDFLDTPELMLILREKSATNSNVATYHTELFQLLLLLQVTDVLEY